MQVFPNKNKLLQCLQLVYLLVTLDWMGQVYLKGVIASKMLSLKQ